MAMSEADKVFAGSIPEFYDTCMVPLIFEVYAADLARRVAATAPRRVLETAAGSGVVTRALAPLLASDAAYTVTDLNQPMLAWAMSRQGADDRIAWQQVDALALPFPDASFDAVCCQFGAMFFPDRVAGYREARRSLAPGGRFLFNVWDRIETNDFPYIVTEALGRLFPRDPPAFLARTPHGYHDVAAIDADLRAAGFEDIEIITLTETSRASSARAVAIAFCHGTVLRNEILARDPGGLETATEHAARALAAAHGEGPVSGPIQAHVVVARA
jgi:ubiquinone/menaquinone biosynthesis C-methylase UbiE